MLVPPPGDEGLAWIVDQGSAHLLLIPGLHTASITAAAAGDKQVLAYLRFTAQQYSAFAGMHSYIPLDAFYLKASGKGQGSTHTLEPAAEGQLCRVYDARRQSTVQLLIKAAGNGHLAALKWIWGLCHPMAGTQGVVMKTAATADCNRAEYTRHNYRYRYLVVSD